MWQGLCVQSVGQQWQLTGDTLEVECWWPSKPVRPMAAQPLSVGGITPDTARIGTREGTPVTWVQH